MKIYYYLPSEKQSFRTERWHHNLGRSQIVPILFLLCSLLLTLLFSLFTLYSFPGSFKAAPKNHADRSRNLVQPLQGYQNCDLFKGHWVPDLNASLYTNDSCRTIPDSKNCFKNGRRDVGFVNWRWKPDDDCELPRFDVKAFLEIVRGKKMAFVGDSVARNQFESLLCLLSKEEIPVVAYKDSDDRYRTWHFPRHDFTLMMLWSRFLVSHEEIMNGSEAGSFNLHVDKVDVGWSEKILDVDFGIISDGHWFFRKIYLYEGGALIGCVYCNQPNITEKGLTFAFRMSFRTALGFINDCKQCRGINTLLRTFSPAHFEHGTWNNGGNCNRTSPERELGVKLGGLDMELRSIQLEEIERARNDTMKKKKKKKREVSFDVLDVTRAMLMRPDGHPGSYWGNKWMKGYNDCVHWCLPGPVDSWNEFLMAMLQRRTIRSERTI